MLQNNKKQFNPQFPFKKSKKEFLIKPEVIKKQKLLFNKDLFGKLQFVFGITYKRSNVFFTFYVKSEKYPNKVFVFYKQSTGLLKRQSGKVAGAPLRGRFKKQYETIRTRMNLVKSYIYEFIKFHPEMVIYKKIYVIWKLYTLTHHIITMLKYPLRFSYNTKVIETLLRERFADEILARLNLRERQNLTDYEIINKYFVKKRFSQNENLPTEIIFKKNKKKQIEELNAETFRKLKEVKSSIDKIKIIKKHLRLLLKFQIDIVVRNEEDQIKKMDPVYYSVAKLALASNLSVQEILEIAKIPTGVINEKNKIKSPYVRLNPLSKPLISKVKPINKEILDDNALIDIMDEMLKKRREENKNKRNPSHNLTTEECKKIVELDHCIKSLRKILKFDRRLIANQQPRIITKFLFKFPHNGCRPPKARRLKRSRRR